MKVCNAKFGQFGHLKRDCGGVSIRTVRMPRARVSFILKIPGKLPMSKPRLRPDFGAGFSLINSAPQPAMKCHARAYGNRHGSIRQRRR